MIDRSLFDKMQFVFPFRKYQNLILSFIEDHSKEDNKYHIVAPPGSGKTIVGLELIKRTGTPALVLSPTTTIQLQWKEKVSFFLSDERKDLLDNIVSTNPNDLKLINTFTYQAISSSGENLDFIEEAAIQEWTNDLYTSGTTPTIDEAAKRIEKIKKNNKSLFRRQISKHYKRIKKEFLNNPDFDGTRLLHPNAQRLINNLVNSGVKTIIMDESHHLLDYWALILKELLKRIEDPILIGLTATPPIGAEEKEMQNYISILGEVDFEVPTPAVVKEGNLAPYQDLVYFTFPTQREKNYIKNIQKAFDSFVSSLIENDNFRQWHDRRFFKRKLENGKKESWTSFFKKHLPLAIAGIKYAKREDIRIPWEIPIVEEMEKPLSIEEWTFLLGDYALNYLATSDNKNNHNEYKKIQTLLKSFGFTLTEKGIRSFRSPADKVLSLSESKNQGVLDILMQEMKNLKDEIRAVVVSDFELESPIITKSFSGILPKGAGSAIRVFETVLKNKNTAKLDPVLVTGKRLLIDAAEQERLIPAMEKWRDSNKYSFEISVEKTTESKILAIKGKGKDWKSSTYVRMITALFEQGDVKCIIGTRGLLAEGWDTLSLNTLIDLTTATTSMMVQQIRGRSLRINPKSPQKVANNWDVVCVEPHFERGDQDFRRFLKKHQRFYGLTSNGSIQKGVGHVDQSLFFSYNLNGFKVLEYRGLNLQMLSKSRSRKKIYEKWEIGKEYQNFEYSIVKLDPTSVKFKTAHTLRNSLRAIFNSIILSITAIFFQYIAFFGDAVSYALSDITLLLACMGIFTIIVVSASIANIVKYIRLAFIEVPIDSFMLDIGKTVLKSLREGGFVEGNLSVDNVRVLTTPEGYYDVFLDYANSEDTNLFTKSLNEVLSPVINQRYIVYRSEADIKMFPYSTIWFILRSIYGKIFEQDKLAYHPVPSVMSTHRKYANIFAKNWKEYVGGGDLIYTRSKKGLSILLKLRRKRNVRVKKMEMNYWK